MVEVISVLHLHHSQAGKGNITHKKAITTRRQAEGYKFYFRRTT